MFFLGFDASIGYTLWKSDGTVAGTGPLLDRSGNAVGTTRSFQTFAGRIFFTNGDGLWQSDGTPAGTFRLRDRIASPELVQAGPRLFFSAYDHDTGTELWAIDAP